MVYLIIYGLPMGGPCSTIFADIVMDDLETECLEKLDFTPVAYYRYIDDIFAIIPEDKIDHMLNVFNYYNNRLQFTHKLVINQGLNVCFLSRGSLVIVQKSISSIFVVDNFR